MTRNSASNQETNAAATLLDALSRRDFGALAQTLAPDVYFRALLPSRIVETKTAEDTVAEIRKWFGSALVFEMDQCVHESVVGRDFVRYRVRFQRPRDTEVRVAEQTAYVRLDEGLVSRIDLLCTGTSPIP